jgi:hypothetical protein
MYLPWKQDSIERVVSPHEVVQVLHLMPGRDVGKTKMMVSEPIQADDAPSKGKIEWESGGIAIRYGSSNEIGTCTPAGKGGGRERGKEKKREGSGHFGDDERFARPPDRLVRGQPSFVVPPAGRRKFKCQPVESV